MRLLKSAGVAALAWLAAAGGCGVKHPVTIMYPRTSDVAERLFRIVYARTITLPDQFVLRPEEFAAVVVDHDRDAIYIGGREGTLLALGHARGEVLWEMDLGGAISSQPLLVSAELRDGWTSAPRDEGGEPAGDWILVGTDNGEIWAIDVDTREERWRYPTEGRVQNVPVIGDGVVYVVNSRDQVFALDARTGDWRWQYEQEFQTDFTVRGRAGLTYIEPASLEGRDLGEHGVVITGFDNGKVVALGANSGEALWISSVAPADGGNFVDCDSTPWVDVASDLVVVAGQSTGVYGLSLRDGSERWRYDVRAASSVVGGRGRDLIFASSLEGVFTIDDAGHHRWRTQVDPGVLSVPVVIGDVIYVTHSERGLLAFNAEQGELLARVDLGSGMSSLPVHDPIDDRFYATTNRGLLLVLELAVRDRRTDGELGFVEDDRRVGWTPPPQ